MLESCHPLPLTLLALLHLPRVCSNPELKKSIEEVKEKYVSSKSTIFLGFAGWLGTER